jgi:hypothetical protein
MDVTEARKLQTRGPKPNTNSRQATRVQLDQSKPRRARHRIGERRDRQKDETRANRNRRGEDHAGRSSQPNHAFRSISQDRPAPFEAREGFAAFAF